MSSNPCKHFFINVNNHGSSVVIRTYGTMKPLGVGDCLSRGLGNDACGHLASWWMF